MKGESRILIAEKETTLKFPEVTAKRFAIVAFAAVVASAAVFSLVTSVRPLPPLGIRHPFIGMMLRYAPFASIPLLVVGTWLALKLHLTKITISEDEARHNEMLLRISDKGSRILVAGRKYTNF